MPLYEYKCDECGQVFEVMQRFSDNPLTTHEGCGGNVQRLLSAPALQFKGSGWYVTDYSRSSGANGKSKDSKDASAAPAKTESSSPSSTASASSDKK